MSLLASDEGNDSEFDGAPSGAILRRDLPAGQPPADGAKHSSRREEKAAEIAADICRAAHRLRGLLAGHFQECGLSDVRFTVLRTLRDGASSGCTQAELAAQLDQSESSVSALVERMRDDNLLYRLRSKSDRRKRLLVLTELGRQMLARVELHHGERVAALLARLDAAQLEQLARLLHTLVDELSRVEPTDAGVAQDAAPSPPHFEFAAETLPLPQPEQHRPVA
jgi:DNA-binding MarR family transcriptional regulator